MPFAELLRLRIFENGLLQTDIQLRQEYIGNAFGGIMSLVSTYCSSIYQYFIINKKYYYI